MMIEIQQLVHGHLIMVLVAKSRGKNIQLECIVFRLNYEVNEVV